MQTCPLDRRAFLLSLAAIAMLPLTVRAAPAGIAGHAAATETPGDSLYRLTAALVDQEGRPFDLASLRGKPVLASMFYTSCDRVCPMIFETIRWTLDALPPGERQDTRILMVTFDPARDSVDALKKAAGAHGCDAQWTLARCSDDTVRKISAVLGIQYRRLASGEFNHSSTIDLLDRQGRIAARSGKLGTVDAALLKALRQAHAAA